MKLLTHNMLTSRVKGVQNGYPLRILAKKIEVVSVEFNGHFIQRMMKKINWDALKAAADSIGHGDTLPVMIPPDYETNQDFLMATHHALLEVEVVDGDLQCPESGRSFPIQEGIPNMLLREEEV